MQILNVSQLSNINAHKSVQHVPHKIPDNARITVKTLESKMQLNHPFISAGVWMRGEGQVNNGTKYVVFSNSTLGACKRRRMDE